MIDFGTLTAGPMHSQSDLKNGFRILLLADTGAAPSATSGSPIKMVDRDNLDEVMASYSPTIELEALRPGGQPIRLSFSSIEALHPDQIFRDSDEFAQWRRIKRQLKGEQSAAAIAEIRSWSGVDLPSDSTPQPVSGSAAVSEPAEITRENWFESIMAETQSAAEAEAANWHQFVRQIIAPIAVQTIEPKLDEYVRIVDELIAGAMRHVLRSPSYRKVEAFWRGLDWLIRRIDTDRNVRVGIWHCPLPELAADVLEAEQLENSEFFRRVVRETAQTLGGKPWSLICPLHDFSLAEPSLGCLGRLTRIAASAGTATASSILSPPAQWNGSGLESWSQLVGMNQATWLSVWLPRFLLRLPYGRSGSRVESFQFEESDESELNLLWGHAAWLAAFDLADQFDHRDGVIDPTDVCTIDGLSARVVDDEYALAGEWLMTESEIKRWIELGVTPVIAYKDSDRVQIQGSQSIARTRWSGPWST